MSDAASDSVLLCLAYFERIGFIPCFADFLANIMRTGHLNISGICH